MKIEFPLSPCPWCKKTPEMHMPIRVGTWNWRIACGNHECRVRPECTVPIRKTSKTILARFRGKLSLLVQKWNQDNPVPPYEKKVIDLTPIQSGFV